MKIKKIKENFEDMALLLSDAVDNGLISEKKYNRFTETFMEASAKLDNMKQLKEENRQLKKELSDIRENCEEISMPDTAEAPARDPFKDEKEELEQEYDEEDELDR